MLEIWVGKCNFANMFHSARIDTFYTEHEVQGKTRYLSHTLFVVILSFCIVPY